MKHGQIAGSKSVNTMIYRCFEYISEEDERKFVKKFKDQMRDEVQVMHTFRELILGSYLASSGFNVSYEYSVDTATPDWCVLDDSSSLKAIVELTNFHLDKATEDAINEARQTKGWWIGWTGLNDERLYQSIWHKAGFYKTLAEGFNVPYIVAVYSEFNAAVDIEELNRCLFGEEFGLFGLYPAISGVLFFEEQSGPYKFTYLPNPNPLKRMCIRSGVF